MNIRKIIKEELDDFVAYGYYINIILDDLKEHIDKSRLKNETYLIDVVKFVYKVLTRKYIAIVGHDETEMLKLIVNKTLNKYL